jgi:hypothetical protein
MQLLGSLFGIVRQSKVLNTKYYECSPRFVFLVTYGAIFYNFLGLGCFPHGALEVQARHALPGDSHVQNSYTSKQLPCCQSQSHVNAHVFFSVTKKHFYLTVTRGIQKMSV